MAQGKNQTQQTHSQAPADSGFSKIVVWVAGAVLIAIIAAALFGVI